MTCTTCTGEIEADALFCGHCGRRTRRRRDSTIGSVIDDTYRIEEKLATGGFGAIYRATHIASGATVALKILHADFAGDAALAGRFLRESKALAKLRDKHTVVTYERGETPDGTLYIAMELLRGESLLERFKRRGPMPWREALAVMRQVCSSLAEAHGHGIIHRDLKPANIHLDHSGFVKVLDFGVAKVLPWSQMDDGTELTLAGQAVGTLEYMAPEQLGGGECDARTDIFALGVVAYEMITGQRPFPEAATPAALITSLFTQSVPIPSTVRTVPGVVDQLLLRCLEREQTDRFLNTQELAAAIDRILSRPTPRGNEAAKSAAGLAQIESRHLAVAPTIAYVLPEMRRCSPSMEAFAFPVRGSVVEARPICDDATEPTGVVPPVRRDRRHMLIWAAGFALGIAGGIAVACLI